MLLGAKVHTMSPTMNAILKSWGKVEGKILFVPIGANIPGHLSITQLLHLMVRAGEDIDQN